MKKLILICNWKLNGNKNLIKKFIIEIYNFIYSLNFNINNNDLIEISISPPVLYIDYTSKLIKNNNNLLSLCSQNVDVHDYGSFTGEISINMLKELFVKYIIIGHSERRNYHNENNFIIMKKFNIIKKNGLIPILCIGENLYEFNENKTKEVCISQIDIIIKKYGIEWIYNTILAYEPIWAIGTGKYANTKHINYVYNFIINHLSSFDNKIKDKIKFLYGGSVSSINSNELIFNTNIDGLLIGKSSLDSKEIINIINFFLKNNI